MYRGVDQFNGIHHEHGIAFNMSICRFDVLAAPVTSASDHLQKQKEDIV